MDLYTGMEAVLAAIGVKIGEMVVEKYRNNKSIVEKSVCKQDESTLTDISLKGVSDEK